MDKGEGTPERLESRNRATINALSYRIGSKVGLVQHLKEMGKPIPQKLIDEIEVLRHQLEFARENR
jgi:phage-related holin